MFDRDAVLFRKLLFLGTFNIPPPAYAFNLYLSKISDSLLIRTRILHNVLTFVNHAIAAHVIRKYRTASYQCTHTCMYLWELTKKTMSKHRKFIQID